MAIRKYINSTLKKKEKKKKRAKRTKMSRHYKSNGFISRKIPKSKEQNIGHL